MNLLSISFKNLKHKVLDTALAIFLLSFGVGIISLMILLKDQISSKFDRNIKDIDFVLAAKGSPIQSILANVYHVDVPTGNIPIAEAKRIIRNPMVEDAIPLAYGDNYEKYRIVGTNDHYPKHYGCEILEGRMFEKPFEVTLGAEVARQTGMKVGSTFTSMHGYDNAAESDPDAHHDHSPFVVVGVFHASGSVIDQLILTPVESVWLVHEHKDEVADTTQSAAADSALVVEEPQREMTAYLIKKRNRGAFGMLSKQVEKTTMQLANVAVENSRLMNNFGLGLSVITAIAIVIMVLSFISIFISLLNSMKERKYELALMRTMGASPSKVFSLIMIEGFLLVVLGVFVGLLLSRCGLLILSTAMQSEFHYQLNQLAPTGLELLLVAGTIVIGLLASAIPAIRAMRVDISKTLSNG